MHLLRTRRFLPLFATQFLGAFNDNLFSTAMVMLVIYGIYRDAEQEATFSAIAGGLFILPFFLLSALAGQLADCQRQGADHPHRQDRRDPDHDGRRGRAAAPQRSRCCSPPCSRWASTRPSSGRSNTPSCRSICDDDEVLGGTGLVEAGTYIAILGGTLLGGVLVMRDADGSFHADWAAVGVLLIALIGRWVGGHGPARPARQPTRPASRWTGTSSAPRSALVSATLHIPRLFLAILAISFFWAMGAVLAAQFPPLVKNALGADQQVATLFLAIFSVGVAIGSVAVNRLLKGQVSARYLAGLGDRHGAVRARPLPPREQLAGAGAELRDLAAFLAVPRQLADRARPARRGDRRRHVRGAALRLPHHHRAQVGDGADHRRQQYRQFGRDGAGDADPDRRGACSGSRSPTAC